ncbi:cobalt/zinc/cadmium resistance heavy metal efflux pump protein CzcA [Novosphingobium sp. Rr 2-17]|uniref:efflux RND transporter permease subunit n=1 Tax=Novosphingobium sp. Rr 2-17 TaxID=555793 RepID=UPI000269983B|nr:efflux RND transporter permease subunit [Novosphingobium sp. Rr 2-17]EIZ79876.1 cobalt/zinc/cadmium resistance heavy metal efflux pump protein CzcA [Novosphingobium sp. Rr 2-17]
MDRFNLSRWAIRHPALVGFLIAILFAAGAAQFMTLGRDEDPGFTLKEMIVAGTWPGASPAQMQAQVANPIERTLRAIDHLDFLETYCVEGGCVTRVSLQDSAPKDRVAGIWQQVRKRLKDIEPTLPQGAAVSADEDNAYVYGYVFTLTGADNARLVRLAEQARDTMLRLPGVAKAQITGEIPRKLFVDIDPRRLAAMGITPDQLARVLGQRTLIAPAGISERSVRVPVRVGDTLDGVSAVEETRLASASGAVRVADIATVSRGYADPPDGLVRHAGRPAVTLALAMAPGADGLALGKQLRDAAADIRQQLPAGVTLTQVEDQSQNIREAVNTFLIKFFCALAVVLIVAFVTLGWRTGIVVALSVPLTLAIVALFMGASGIGLERISLGALILSLGLLVDDAIISVEAMVVQLEKGASRADAAAFAWTHTAFPMLTGTLLTVIGFLPVGFAESTTSEYAGGIFWVTGSALIVSWFVAVVFTPYLGVRLLPEVASGHAGNAMYDTPIYRRLAAIIAWCIEHGRLVIWVTLGLLLASGAGMLLVRQQFFPLSDRPEVIVDLSLKPGTSITATSAAVSRMEHALAGNPDIRHLDSYVGQGAPRFYLPYGPLLPNSATATLVLVATDLDARERLITRLTNPAILPEAKIHVHRLSLGPSAGFPIQYRVIGPDPSRLRMIADRLTGILRATRGTTAVQVNWGAQTPVARFDLDADRVARLGLDRGQIADAMNTVLSGQSAGEVLQDTKRIGIVVRGQAADRSDLGRLPDMAVPTPNGPVPLSQIGHMTIATEDPIVWTRNGERVVTVEADTFGDIQPADILTDASPRVAALVAALPAGYRIEVGGDEELSAKANNAIYKLLPITLAAMLLLLMVQLQSLGRTLLVLATAPLGLIGAVAALLVTGQPFGFVALLGLIALAGMIMRNAIILVDQVQSDFGDGAEGDLRGAIITATVARSRPVVLTALAAVLAFIPLCFNIFWGPMAIVMIGGLIGATLLTLLALPALYALAFDRGRKPEPSHA